MSEVNFRSLQSMHESLLQKHQYLTEENQQDFTKEVRDYLEQAKRAGSNIPTTRERDQIRANLRYWGNYIYSIDKTFPDTELAPSSVESKPYLSTSAGRLTIILLAIIVLAVGFLTLRAVPPNPTAEATTTAMETGTALLIATPETTSTPQPSPTLESVQAIASATEESSGFNITLSGPANGDFITPNIEFKGTFENLKPGWTIHVLLIKGDKFFPVKEDFPIPDKLTSNDWMIQTTLAESPDEMAKAQSYSVVLALSLDSSSRKLLSGATETGVDINSLPPTVIPFQNTSRVLFRNPFKVVHETRLVYPFHTGITYDIYTSKPDGSDILQITSTDDISERWPKLSPDGKRIVYVKYFTKTDTFAISIMDSNGQNDHEIISDSKNVLEDPQWSPDSSYISYAMGGTGQISNTTYWSIHVYQLLTKEAGNISGEPRPVFFKRYHCWIPNSNDIVFNADAIKQGTSSFMQVAVDSPQSVALFFDTEREEIQPNVNILGDGYLLTYTVVNPDFSHDVFAVIDTDAKIPFDGTPIRLTRTSTGSDYPLLEPASRIIYYARTGLIYKVEFNLEGNKIILIQGRNTNDGEHYGDEVVSTGPTRDNNSFDIKTMDTFFPIE